MKILILLWSMFAVEAQARSYFTPTCIVPKAGSNGTITAVYMSGQYPQFKGSDVFTNWETGNRAKLQAVADATGATIAVPQANVRNLSTGMDFTWIGVQPSLIIKRAKAACKGMTFDHPGLIAFSSGAKRVTVLLESIAAETGALPPGCGSLGVFSRIVIMGDQGAHGNYNGGCNRRIHQVENHNFPPPGINLQSEIEKMLKQADEAAPDDEPTAEETPVY